MKNMSKIRAVIFRALPLLCLAGLSSCNYGFFWGLFGEDNVDVRSSSMTSLNSSAPEIGKSLSEYSILVITDLHYGAHFGSDKERAFLDWLRKRFESGDEKKIPRFIVNLGDTADGGHRSEFSDYAAFAGRIKKLAEDCGIDGNYKVYSVLGNHDLYNNGVEHYEDLCYPYISSYYFDIDVDAGGFGFYFLDTANGTLGLNQLEDLKSRLMLDPRPKIVFTHYPIYAGANDPKTVLMRLQNSMERNMILSYLTKYNARHVYEGHIHARMRFDFKIFREDVIQSFRYGEAALLTVNAATGQVSTEIVFF